MGYGKYARVERERKFLLIDLPPGLAPRDAHVQITDNYITGTRLRLRKMRATLTRERVWKLTQKFAPAPPDFSRTIITNIYLTQYEYEVLSVFEGNEIRKNRYRYDHEGRTFAIDVFLGSLRGLVLAETDFETDEEMDKFMMPSFATMDVSHDELFTGAKLASLSFEEIREELNTRVRNEDGR